VDGIATTTVTFAAHAIHDFTVNVNGSGVGLEYERLSEISYVLRFSNYVPGHYELMMLSVSSQITFASASIEIVGPFYAFNVIPSESTLIGGKLVTIFGSGFSNVTELSCWFNDVPVPAVVSSPSALICKTPAWILPQVVSVSVNGRGSLPFEFSSPLSIQRVFPTVGLVSTAFMVAVQADGLLQSGVCKVNDIETVCLLENPRMCRCLVSVDVPGISHLYFALNDRQFIFTGHLEIALSLECCLCIHRNMFRLVRAFKCM